MILFAATIALSAFLLFLIQPIIARQILPWFGGSAAVWTTCLVFFQVALFAGYAYSDWTVRRLSATRQAILHSILLVTSLSFLPTVVPEALKPVATDQPIMRILAILALTIGLPYVLLATTGPLVQAWFNRRYHGARVYRLYALSNIASMLALASYPPLIEPYASGRNQAHAWSIGYGLFVVLALAAAWSGRRAPLASVSTPPATTTASAPPSAAAQGVWLVLAALGSVLLLSITAHTTQNIASIPFLWVLPLAIYLLTFVLCFDGSGWYWRRLYPPLAALAAVVMLAALSFRVDGWEVKRALMNIEYGVPLYALGLFICCMFLHGELVERKPAPAWLTRFYLMVSAGGAIGGVLVGVVAPVFSDWYWELPVALVVVASLVAVTAQRWSARAIGLLGALGCAGLLFDYVGHIRQDAVAVARNFYGTLRVAETYHADGALARRRLLHGVILHGDQYFDADLLHEPTTYYGRTSGVGQTITALRQAQAPLRVGMIGVGTGTLAAYGEPNDVFRLYELNPMVYRFADRWFTYLKDSRATIERVTGDARIMLEGEPDQRFDVLAVDAFSSDSIPIHLITREALALYRRHLSSRGAVLFHISNRYLALEGIVARLADDGGMYALRFDDKYSATLESVGSDWIAVTADPQTAQRLNTAGGMPLKAQPARDPLWSDDHHNLFQVLKH